jgi:hypothetical protein
MPLDVAPRAVVPLVHAKRAFTLQYDLTTSRLAPFRQIYKVMKIPTNTLRRMSSRADRALAKVLLRGATIMRHPPRTEVGFVAAVTLDGIGAVARAWESHLAPLGLSVNIQGVFCHGAPQVTTNKFRCELADLLIVVDRRDCGYLVRRATLIQAKMAWRKQLVQLTGESSAKQLELYQDWPRFRFVDAGYGPSSFRLAGSQHGQGGSFGVIDRHLILDADTTPPVWTQHNPRPTPAKVTGEPELGSFLTWMLAGRPGFGRNAPESPKDDWSKVVELLLTVTYAKTFGHPPTLGELRPSRGFSAFLVANGLSRNLFAARSSTRIPPIDSLFDMTDEPSEKTISVLHVEIASEGS